LETRVLGIISGLKRDDVTGKWRRLLNEELYDLYRSSKVIRVIRSRRMRWAGCVARVGEGRGAAELWWGDLRERDEFECLCVDWRITLKLIFKKWNSGVDWIDMARDLADCFE